jgi:hypothetical protein
MTDREEFIDRSRHIRDVQLADWITLTMGIAVEVHPDAIRDMLAKVFDISAIEELCKRTSIVAANCQARATEAKALLEAVARDVEALEKRFDALAYAMELLERRVVSFGRQDAADAKPAPANGTHEKSVKR